MTDYLHNVKIIKDKSYKIVAITNIPKNTIVMRSINQYYVNNKTLNTAFKNIIIIHNMIVQNECELFPRSGDNFTLDPLYIKLLDDSVKQLLCLAQFVQIKNTLKTINRNTLIRFYAKFIFNAFMIHEDNIGPVINITGARINHNCNPNVNFTPVYDNTIGEYVLEFKTNRLIKAGEEIYDSYLQNQPCLTYVSRIKYLKQHYDFDCNCSLCKTKT